MIDSNISTIKNCYGCGVCATVCPQNIIRIELNKKGFYQPVLVDADKCTQCGLCLKVCAYSDSELSLTQQENIEGYASWSNDKQVRRKCSSGGIGFEIGKLLIEQGYKACGVRYNATEVRAEHFIANSVQEFIPSIGSKYIQSYTVDGFSKFKKGNKYFVTGTPCQIDSLRRYFRLKKMEDNVVLLDFFCHGVPSMHLWNKYLNEVEKLTGKTIYASWRNKQTGWHDSWVMGIDGQKQGDSIDWHDSYNMLIKGEKTFYTSRLSQGDIFYKLFLSDSCLGKACYEKCKYKATASSADIRIGDLWGETYKDNEQGVSGLLAFTIKGKQIVECLKANHTIIPGEIEIITEGQMQKSPPKPLFFNIYMRILRDSRISLKTILTAIQNEGKTKYYFKLLSQPSQLITKVQKKISVNED